MPLCLSEHDVGHSGLRMKGFDPKLPGLQIPEDLSPLIYLFWVLERIT